MEITTLDKIRRAQGYIRKEITNEINNLKKYESINIKEIIIMRNKKQMYIAELQQMERNMTDEILSLEAGA